MLTLTVEELFRSHTRCVLEHTGEVLGVFKTHFIGHLVDTLAAKNEALGTPYQEIAYVVLRTLAKGISDDVTKIAWRQT